MDEISMVWFVLEFWGDFECVVWCGMWFVYVEFMYCGDDCNYNYVVFIEDELKMYEMG